MSDRIRPADDFMRGLRYHLPANAVIYRVGGSVRDELLDRRPKDADYVVTNSSLTELSAAVSAAGARVSRLQLRDGRQVGVRANLRGIGLVEIALPRTERSTGPLRSDFDIVCDPSVPISEDAMRRDFTINTFYRDIVTGEVTSPLSGEADLRNRVLRTTDPNSFRDDALRILRALRFVSQLGGFSLHESAYDEMVQHADAVTGMTDKGVSGTALDELNKLLMGRRCAKALRIARDTGVLAAFLPELEPMLGFEQESKYHDMTTDEHTFTALDAAAALHLSLRVRLGLLFHDSGKPAQGWQGEDGRLHYYAMPREEYEYRKANLITIREASREDHETVGARIADQALRRLNAPAKLRREVVTLVQRHMVPISGRVKPAKVRRWRVELGDELLSDLFKHRLADCMGKGTIDNEALVKIAKLEEAREEAARQGVPTSAKDLHIDGHDLLDLGLEGQSIGRVQKQLLHEVVSQPKLNDPEWLKARAGALAVKEKRRCA